MATTIISSREFNQDRSSAKKAAERGPVIITDRGRPSHVLLSFDDYNRIKRTHTTRISDLLAMPEAADIEFNTPRLKNLGLKPAELG